MSAAVQRRMRETQQPSYNSGFADGATGRGMLVMRPVSLQQPGSSQAKQILSRYRPIAPKPVSDQTTTTASAQSSLSTDNASTTKSKPRGSRKRPSETSSSKLPKSKKQTTKPATTTEDGFRYGPEMAVELHGGYENLTPLFPVRVAHQFGPGGWQRFHDSFGVSASAAPNCGPSDADSRRPTADSEAGLSLHIAVGGARTGRFSTAENEMSRLFQPRGCSSSNFGTDSDVTCSSEKSDIVTLALLPDTPSNVRCGSGDRWSAATVTAAATSSDLNTSLTMASTGCRGTAQDGAAAVPTAVVDVHHLEQRYGGSSEAVLLADEFDQLLWTNAAFERLSHERCNSRLQAMAPHIDPLGIRTQLATLTFQPAGPAPKCKAVLWGFLKKFILHEAMEFRGVQSQSWL